MPMPCSGTTHALGHLHTVGGGAGASASTSTDARPTTGNVGCTCSPTARRHELVCGLLLCARDRRDRDHVEHQRHVVGGELRVGERSLRVAGQDVPAWDL